MQDLAAQYVPGFLAAPAGGRVLDACAAPGGKSANLLEACPDLHLTCLDVDADRLARVRETLSRLRLPAADGSVRCVAADAGAPDDWWDGGLFDRILLDAPCSASGVIRRHPDIKLLRRDDDSVRLAQEQARLLRALWPLLAPGGRLLYVTCSVFQAENDDIVDAFARENTSAEVFALDFPNARNTRCGRQILPGEDGMDGFYYACLIKR